MSLNTYNGFIQEFSAVVYTNFSFTGTDKLTVTLSGNDMYSWLNRWSSGSGKGITIKLIDPYSWNSIVGSVTASCGYPQYELTGSFNNLDPNKVYYVKISKAADDEYLRNLSLSVYR